MDKNITTNKVDSLANDNDDKVKVDVNGSLMKKTKVQLIEIILRKDDVEHDLRSTILDNESEINRMTKEYQSLESQFNILKHDYIDECDNNALDRLKLHNTIFKLKVILSVICIICFALMTMLVL